MALLPVALLLHWCCGGVACGGGAAVMLLLVLKLLLWWCCRVGAAYGDAPACGEVAAVAALPRLFYNGAAARGGVAA